MRWDLKAPCKNCPFGNVPTRITFSGRERAEEIEESAYRHGFPCHLSAHNTEDDGDEEGGFVFSQNTQHCIGALLMYLWDGDGNVPFENLTEAKQDRIRDRLNWNAPVFHSPDAFLDANTERKRKRA